MAGTGMNVGARAIQERTFNFSLLPHCFNRYFCFGYKVISSTFIFCTIEKIDWSIARHRQIRHIFSVANFRCDISVNQEPLKDFFL